MEHTQKPEMARPAAGQFSRQKPGGIRAAGSHLTGGGGVLSAKLTLIATLAALTLYGVFFTGCPSTTGGDEGDTTTYTPSDPNNPGGDTTYTVTFNANDGGDGSSVSALPAPITGLASGAKITAPATNPARAGYDFGGWYKETGCTNVWVFATDTVTANTGLYAKWTAATYTVTFNANDGGDGSSVSGLPAPITGLASGATITAPATDPTRTGGNFFGGWYKEAACTNAWNFATDAVTANTDLYAKWTTYALGDTGPGGGKVFYVSEAGFTMTDNGQVCHYLEAALEDSGTLAWASTDYTSTSISGTETDIGTGRNNTALILAEDAAAPAAFACKTPRGGKNDWFLPSKDELNQLYTEKDTVGGFGTDWYWCWSSSQQASNYGYAWVQFFGSDYQDVNAKANNEGSVRAVRAF